MIETNHRPTDVLSIMSRIMFVQKAPIESNLLIETDFRLFANWVALRTKFQENLVKFHLILRALSKSGLKLCQVTRYGTWLSISFHVTRRDGERSGNLRGRVEMWWS